LSVGFRFNPTELFCEIGKIAEDTVNMEKKEIHGSSDKWAESLQSVFDLALGKPGAGTHGAIAE